MIRYDCRIRCDFAIPSDDGERYECLNELRVPGWFTKPPGKIYLREKADPKTSTGRWDLGWSRDRLDLCPEHSTPDAKWRYQEGQPKPTPRGNRQLRGYSEREPGRRA
jgi:hypothetical protein